KSQEEESLLLKTLEAEKDRRRTQNRLNYYRPYKKQLEFHQAGAAHRERLLMAGNQFGKKFPGGLEAAKHATSRYPVDWTGKRFDRPTVGWACARITDSPSWARTNVAPSSPSERLMVQLCNLLAL